MTTETSQVVWLESRSDYSIHELVELSGLPASLLGDLIDCGALPVEGTSTTVRFEAESVVLARAAQRIQEHFELDDRGLAVAVTLLRRVRALEAQLSNARARSRSETD